MRIRTPHDIAAVARGRRTDLGLTQGDLAARVGVSRKWVSDFETGKTTADLATVLRLFDILGVWVDAAAGPEPPGGAVDLDQVLDRYLRG